MATDQNEICNHGRYRGMCCVCTEIAHKAEIARLNEEISKLRVAGEREPSGFAHRYQETFGDGTVIRFNNGEEVNGSCPIETVPYWFSVAPQACPVFESYKTGDDDLDLALNLQGAPGDYAIAQADAIERLKKRLKSVPAAKDSAKHVLPSVGDRVRWAQREFMKLLRIQHLGEREGEAFAWAVGKQITEDRQQRGGDVSLAVEALPAAPSQSIGSPQ